MAALPEDALTLRAQVSAALAPLADPVKAEAMGAYMKGHFPYLGIQTPTRRQATRPLLRSYAGDPIAVARALWQLPQREYQYVACDLLLARAARLPAAALDDLLALAAEKAWWDSVDALAHAVGDLVHAQRSLQRRMDRLIDDADLWLVRIALLHQLGWKQDTDTRRLFRYCLRRADEGDFFVRKAIGWALRDYAWHDPAAVGTFIDTHGEKLSKLSVREASKNL